MPLDDFERGKLSVHAARHIAELEAARRRLNRIERDIRNLEETIREQAVGEQDGYVLQVADDLQRILA